MNNQPTEGPPLIAPILRSLFEVEREKQERKTMSDEYRAHIAQINNERGAPDGETMDETQTDKATPRDGEDAQTVAAFAAFRNSVGFQFGFFQYSGLAEDKAIDHICNAAEKLVKALVVNQSQHVEGLIAVAREAARIHVCCCGPRDASPCLKCTADAALIALKGNQQSQVSPKER